MLPRFLVSLSGRYIFLTEDIDICLSQEYDTEALGIQLWPLSKSSRSKILTVWLYAW